MKLCIVVTAVELPGFVASGSSICMLMKPEATGH